jgi:hypothetical protein
MIEWLESYFLKKISPYLWLRTIDFPERVCNEIIELDNGKYTNETILLFREKRGTHRFRKC